MNARHAPSSLSRVVDNRSEQTLHLHANNLKRTCAHNALIFHFFNRNAVGEAR